jgi:hypothetical protein
MCPSSGFPHKCWNKSLRGNNLGDWSVLSCMRPWEVVLKVCSLLLLLVAFASLGPPKLVLNLKLPQYVSFHPTTTPRATCPLSMFGPEPYCAFTTGDWTRSSCWPTTSA